MALSQEYINKAIGSIQILHARYADQFCNILKMYTGETIDLDRLADVNNNVGWVIDILYNYTPFGIAEINDKLNGLTEGEIQILIDWCYRTLYKYGSKLFIPDNPNIYL